MLRNGGIILDSGKEKAMEGDQHKIREALELAITIGDWCCAQTDDPLECCEFSCAYQVEPHGEAGADCPWKKIRAALAAPPRNCDVGTAEEQGERQKAYCRKHFTPDKLGGNCRKCPLKNRRGWSCQLAWAQMPYAEEGGAK